VTGPRTSLYGGNRDLTCRAGAFSTLIPSRCRQARAAATAGALGGGKYEAAAPQPPSSRATPTAMSVRRNIAGSISSTAAMLARHEPPRHIGELGDLFVASLLCLGSDDWHGA
jgi:hypothetical protein